MLRQNVTQFCSGTFKDTPVCTDRGQCVGTVMGPNNTVVYDTQWDDTTAQSTLSDNGSNSVFVRTAPGRPITCRTAARCASVHTPANKSWAWGGED